MKDAQPLTWQCVHCGAPAEDVKYHSRYLTRDGMRTVFRCRRCRKTFCDRYGTAFYDLKTPEQKVLHAVHQVMEGASYESVERIEEVHPTSVQRWIERAAEQATLADHQIVQRVEAQTIEMDELYGFAGTKQQTPQSREDETGKHWVHCSMVRESRLVVEVEVGPRTGETAQTLVENTAHRLAEGCWPLWCSDGWESYVEALLAVFHVMIYFIRTGRRGRPRNPRRIAHPSLRYGQVVKLRVGRRLASVTKRVVFGVTELVPLLKISTSLLERLNGTLRGHVSPMKRRTRAFAKCRTTLDRHVRLFKSYYNLCLPHASLEGQTPAQAAGLTNHRFAVYELLTYGGPNISKIS